MTGFDRNVYDRYGLLQLPRTWGFPVQITIKSVKQIEHLITNNDGKFPIFMSANAHDNNYVLFSQLYSDFDGHGKHTMEEALRDERKIVEHFESEKLDFLIDITGRGFRTLLKVDPVIRRIQDVDGIIKGYSRHLKDSLGLKTMDMKVAEPKRILRPPLTQYIYYDREKKENIFTNRHVLPLDTDTLFNSDLNELLYLSETLQFKVMPVSQKRMNLSEMAEYERKIEYVSNGEPLDEDIDFMEFSPEYFREQVNDIIRDIDPYGHDTGPDINLIKKLYTPHPDHHTLFLACIKVKESNYHLNLNSTLSFFAKLSLDAKWNHRNLKVQKEQISSIFNADYKVMK